jgi:hypothetical protein
MGQKPFVPDDFEPLDTSDFEPIEEPKIEAKPVEQVTTPPEDNRSVFKRGWDTISNPLADIMQPQTPEAEAASGLMHKEHPYLSKGADLLGGLISSASSPLALATMGTGAMEGAAAKFGAPAVANAAKWIGRGLGTGDVLSGAEDVSKGNYLGGGLQMLMGGATFLPRTHAKYNPLPDRLANVAKEAEGIEPIKIENPDRPMFPPKRNPVTGKMESTKPSSGNLPEPPLSDKEAIKLREKLKKFNTIEEVIDNAKNRTDLSEAQKAKLIDRINANQISATGEVPNNPGIVGQANNISKTLLTSYDISAPGRQGLALWNTKAFWTSWDDMFKSWGSQRAYNELKEGIKSKEMFKDAFDANGKRIKSFAEESGLSLPDILGGREERFAKSFAEKFPGVKASERAYTGFLNKLRADHFETLINQAEALGLNPKGNPKLAQDIAKFVNTATGRGSLGPLEQYANGLNQVFFSPRYMASRLQMLNPMYYANMEPFARKQALKSLAALTGASATINGLYAMAGADVSLDPTSADFMKSKFGNVRMDPNTGLQQPIVLGTRLIKEIMDKGPGMMSDALSPSFTGSQGRPGPYDHSAGKYVGQFMMNKFGPVASFLTAISTGTDFDYKPFELKRAILQRTVPIMAQDIYSLMSEDPSMGVLIPFAAAGQGVSAYSR